MTLCIHVTLPNQRDTEKIARCDFEWPVSRPAHCPPQMALYARCHPCRSCQPQLGKVRQVRFPLGGAYLFPPDAAIQADALRKRRVAVEEEILATIEGYNPVWRRPCSGQQVLTATTFSDELRRKEIARKRDEIRCGNPPQPHRRALQSAAARSFVHAGKWSRHEAFLNMR